MARPLRFEYPGAIYHITSRGNDGRSIFEDTQDRQALLGRLTNIASRFNWAFYAYCLMDNHYHLVVETLQPNLSRGMAWLNGGYAQYFNKRHESTGHLFQSRFKGLIVQREAYLLTVLRYTVLNPVRAGICRLPEKYAHSSYLETLGQVSGRNLIQAGRVLALFGQDPKRARDVYREFVQQGIRGRSLHEDVKAAIFLGDDRFVAEHTIDLADERLPEITAASRPNPQPPLKHLIPDPTDLEAIYTAFCEWDYSARQLGEYLGKHYSTVSRMIKKYELGQSS